MSLEVHDDLAVFLPDLDEGVLGGRVDVARARPNDLGDALGVRVEADEHLLRVDAPDPRRAICGFFEKGYLWRSSRPGSTPCSGAAAPRPAR
jgi:hypothetical protein